MQAPVRITFDPALPVIVAWPELRVGETVLASDDPLPWRELGLSEQTLHDFWRAGAVAFVAVEPPASEHSDAVPSAGPTQPPAVPSAAARTGMAASPRKPQAQQRR